MQSYLYNGWAEEAPASRTPGKTWYLPHHGVYQQDTTCRNVRRFGGALRNLSERSVGVRTESPRRTDGNPAVFSSLPGWTTGRHRKDVSVGGSSPGWQGRIRWRRKGSKGVTVDASVLRADLLTVPRY
ncbi:hypothetical protein T07_7198 [Trichinella nelsoni]|uniref:DUF5641 domain-containing protein n=1 Tax=Trichinella nelsoni TaxID=6336 RepID=A0A0V0S175_9BILA|nr:hypothetical protein T07_2503 [Trichinella nelsoni]KRX20399.1 hypothetical protein T07_7198 [Trichinella nelsoni]